MAVKKKKQRKDSIQFMSVKDVKKLLELGKSRGVLTYEEVNDLIPTDITDIKQVDAVMEFLSDNDIEIDQTIRTRDEDEEASSCRRRSYFCRKLFKAC